MATPRRILVDPINPRHYHLTTRCVRKSFLYGYDRTSRRDFSHRKRWLTERLDQLVPCFAVELSGLAIMDDHFHLVVFYHPTAAQHWSDSEVADRWFRAFPPRDKEGAIDADLLALKREILLEQPRRLAHARQTLGSVSHFMKHLKQPIAVRANREDGCKGHFFEQRFYSGVLLDDEAVLAAMAYVDLNPVRAEIAKTIEACKHTAIDRRLQQVKNTPERLRAAIEPLVTGLGELGHRFSCPLADYVERLEAVIASHAPRRAQQPAKLERWLAQVASLGKRQRAYGAADVLGQWLRQRKMRPLEAPLPE